jgi:hypothetical protein
MKTFYNLRGHYDELSPKQLDWCRREAEQALEAAALKVFGVAPKEEEKTVKHISSRIYICLTVSKLSHLQRFILKAAFSNKFNQAALPSPWKTSWNKDAPWRDVTDEEVAVLYYGIGEYAPPRSDGFSRCVLNRKVSRKVKGKARAAISRAMKRLEQRGLIERFGQNRDEGVFYASCNLTLKGVQVAERLARGPLEESPPETAKASPTTTKESAPIHSNFAAASLSRTGAAASDGGQAPCQAMNLRK